MMRCVKRVFDVFVSFVSLLALSPLFLCIALAIGAAMGRPVFFTQERPGLGGRAFRLIKFRSMSDQRNAAGELLSDEERLGRVGRFIRSWSLDELPQLINVLRGDMSLVGPRPLLLEYLPLYTPDQFRRHDVRPGITGLAQVKGRNAVNWEQKFALDLCYVDHWSFWLDIKILAMTVSRIASRTGIAHEGHVAMPKFRGSQQKS